MIRAKKYILSLILLSMSLLTSQVTFAQFRSKSPVVLDKSSTIDSNQYKVERCWSGDCQNGYGKYFFAKQKALYSGSFQNGLPEGTGEAVYSNGEHFRGEWSQGYFNGYGQLQLSDGEQVQGLWKRGELVRIEEKGEKLEEHYGKVYAIVIGISQYPHMPALKYSDDDAYQLFAHLRSEEGGSIPKDQISLLIDDVATEKNIEMAFQSVFSKAKPEDMVFVYFSGHGEDDAILPYDYDGVSQKVFYKEIKTIIEASSAGCKFLALDACHSGSAFRSKGIEDRYSSFVDWSEGTIYLLSSKKEETSLESDGLRQGVFSHFLLKGLSGRADMNADRSISVQELYSYINSSVIEYTNGRQHPSIEGNYNPSSALAVIRE